MVVAVVGDQLNEISPVENVFPYRLANFIWVVTVVILEVPDRAHLLRNIFVLPSEWCNGLACRQDGWTYEPPCINCLAEVDGGKVSVIAGVADCSDPPIQQHLGAMQSTQGSQSGGFPQIPVLVGDVFQITFGDMGMRVHNARHDP